MPEPISIPQMQDAPAPSALPPVIIIADDLTGASDSAVAFLQKARTVRVSLKNGVADQPIALEPGMVFAFSTESRNMGASEAAQAVERVARAIGHAGSSSILFKKIDSAGRGHLAAETLAALESSGAALALVAPAFPAAGRTVSDGTLQIRDSAHQDASMNLPSLFPASHRDQLELLPTADIPELEQAIRRAMERGIRILLCDAIAQQDLDHLAMAASRIDQPILWTGSAGLARSLASLFATRDDEQPCEPISPEGRTLLFVGTDHPVTQLQLNELHRDPAITAGHIHRIEWNGTSAETLRAVFQESPVSTLILTGGDTTAFVLTSLNASSIRLAGELALGIPWGFIEGGDADGCRVITKSGGFGQRDTLVHAFNFCSRRICEPA